MTSCSLVGQRKVSDVQVLQRRPQAEPHDPLALHEGSGQVKPGKTSKAGVLIP